MSIKVYVFSEKEPLNKFLEILKLFVQLIRYSEVIKKCDLSTK